MFTGDETKKKMEKRRREEQTREHLREKENGAGRWREGEIEGGQRLYFL